MAVQVRETSGRSGATVTRLTFSADSRTATATPSGTDGKIAAGGSVTFSGDLSIVGSIAPQMTVSVSFTDDGGRTGTVSSSASVTTIAPVQRYSLVGFVKDANSGRGIGGATIRISSGPDSGQSSTSADNGYYTFGALQAGTFNVTATAGGYLSFSKSVTLNENTQSDFGLSPTPPSVEYRITGTARRCDATYQNSTGGTNQATVNIPFSYSWNGARSGDFLYMSCQISTGGDTGRITVAIYKNGSLYRSAEAVGFPNIATASGSY
jgi:hypothetical protein